MARDVRAAYDKAAREAAATAVIPVGEAWTRAIEAGVADANPYDGIDAGKVDLWTYDHYHASTYGYYLEALVVFGGVTGRDPRSLGDAECSGFELGPHGRRSRRWSRWPSISSRPAAPRCGLRRQAAAPARAPPH
jgi:hypothetical protein